MKMKFLKSALSVSIVLTISLLSFITANAVEIPQAPTEGKCGDNIFWEFDDTTKTLTISGYGTMYDYESDNKSRPWTYQGIGNYYLDLSIETIIISDGISKIGNNAFSGLSGLSKVDLPDDLISIGEYSFASCQSLKSIELPEKLETIGEHAFYSSGIEKIVIPSSVEKIAPYTFYLCQSLSEIQLNQGLQIIDKCAFINCYSLKTVKFPSTLTNIRDRAFSACNSLETIEFSDGNFSKN